MMVSVHSSSQNILYEEVANSVTHGIGTLLAIAGVGVLIPYAYLYGDAWHIVACSIFGATMVLLYMCSTLYHALPWPRIKRVFRLLDHAAIFLLIAGTYTPFTLINLRGPWGWSLFGSVWGLAILGIIFQFVLSPKWHWLSIGLYVVMGWVIIIAIKPLLDQLPTGGLFLLVTGGVSYMLGIPFYIAGNIPFHHAIWHLFVLTGTTLHYFSILLYVVPIVPG